MRKDNPADFIGKKYGRLTILSHHFPQPVGSKFDIHRWFDCSCDCGAVVVKRLAYLKNGDTRSCGCIREDIRPEGYNGISCVYYRSIRDRAKRLERQFSVTMEELWNLFILQDKRCALSGVTLVLEKTGRKNNKNTASLDRIDSNRGYVNGNVQWTHKLLNRIKQELPQDEFIEWCHKISNHHRHLDCVGIDGCKSSAETISENKT